MKRMKKNDRRAMLLEAAVNAAEKYGYGKFNRDHITEFSGTSPTLITAYYPTVLQLNRAIMRYAIQHERLAIIAEGVVTGDKQAKKASQELKEKALLSIGS